MRKYFSMSIVYFSVSLQHNKKVFHGKNEEMGSGTNSKPKKKVFKKVFGNSSYILALFCVIKGAFFFLDRERELFFNLRGGQKPLRKMVQMVLKNGLNPKKVWIFCLILVIFQHNSYLKTLSPYWTLGTLGERCDIFLWRFCSKSIVTRSHSFDDTCWYFLRVILASLDSDSIIQWLVRTSQNALIIANYFCPQTSILILYFFVRIVRIIYFAIFLNLSILT